MEAVPRVSKRHLYKSWKTVTGRKKEVSLPNVSVLMHDFLLFPVGRHVMVPRHTALTHTQTKEFLTARKLEASQLPNLKVTDPVAMYYGFPVDSIVRIERPGWDVYRVVVA
jgi:DNA-directed RNA polymerase subunit H (RpoH/RPB5)